MHVPSVPMHVPSVSRREIVFPGEKSATGHRAAAVFLGGEKCHSRFQARNVIPGSFVSLFTFLQRLVPTYIGLFCKEIR